MVGSYNFSAQFIKIIFHFKKNGYNFNVLQQTARLVVNPITVGNFAFLFNCTPVCQASNSITVLTLRHIYWWDVRDLMLWLLSGPPGLTCWIFLHWYWILFTVEPLSLLYLLFISWFICSRRSCIDKLRFFSCKPNIYVSWSTSELRVRLARRETAYSPPVNILQTVPRQCFFFESFILFLSCFCYAFVNVCCVMPCGYLQGICWPLGSRVWCLIVKLSLSHWYPWSGVVFDCIDSWSLSFFLTLCFCAGKYFTILSKWITFITHTDATS